jgi:hypothetical protein
MGRKGLHGARKKVMLNWLPETTNLLTTVIMIDATQ